MWHSCSYLSLLTFPSKTRALVSGGEKKHQKCGSPGHQAFLRVDIMQGVTWCMVSCIMWPPGTSSLPWDPQGVMPAANLTPTYPTAGDIEESCLEKIKNSSKKTHRLWHLKIFSHKYPCWKSFPYTKRCHPVFLFQFVNVLL